MSAQPDSLDLLTPEEVLKLLRQHLADVANLSAYIDRVGPPKIWLRNFSGQPLCVDLPVVTIAGEAVAEVRFQKARDAIRLLSEYTISGNTPEYDGLRRACVLPDGTDDLPLTAKVLQMEAEGQQIAPVAFPQDTLDRLSFDQIKERIGIVLVKSVDLAAYLAWNTKTGEAQIRTFPITPPCPMVPAPAALGAALSLDVFDKVYDLLARLNSSILFGQSFEIDTIAAECL